MRRNSMTPQPGGKSGEPLRARVWARHLDGFLSPCRARAGGAAARAGTIVEDLQSQDWALPGLSDYVENQGISVRIAPAIRWRRGWRGAGRSHQESGLASAPRGKSRSGSE